MERDARELLDRIDCRLDAGLSAVERRQELLDLAAKLRAEAEQPANRALGRGLLASAAVLEAQAAQPVLRVVPGAATDD
jgi:hypothetical protein